MLKMGLGVKGKAAKAAKRAFTVAKDCGLMQIW
jgi:hypothetical protein